VADPDDLIRQMYDKRGYLFEWQAMLATEAPEFLEAFDKTWTVVNSDRPGGLEAKYREMVYSTVASVLGEDAVARNHMHKALDLGCTRGELVDALLVAWTPTGSRTLIHGLRTLASVLEERGEYEPMTLPFGVADREERNEPTD